MNSTPDASSSSMFIEKARSRSAGPSTPMPCRCISCACSTGAISAMNDALVPRIAIREARGTSSRATSSRDGDRRVAAVCGILRGVTVASVARLLVAPLLLVSGVALAASFDGGYTGTISCPAFPNQPPLRVAIAVTVSGRTATYEQIAKPGMEGDLGAHEAGSGGVSPSGEILLTGSCRGGFSCVTEYRGDLSKTPIRLKGSQRWWFRSGEPERQCDVELTRPKS